MKLAPTTLLATLAVSLLAPAAALAGPKDRAPDGSDFTLNGRRGDITARWMLRDDGTLYRGVGKMFCTQTTQVDDIKVPQHGKDPAALYYVREGALLAIDLPASSETPKDCPNVTPRTLVPNLGKRGGAWSFKLVDRSDTPIFLVAEDANGRVMAFDAEGVAVTVDGVKDFKVNPCFGSKKSFGSYVAFAIDSAGLVSKIGGKDPRTSKAAPETYKDLAQFEKKNRVCR